ncbi:MAG: fused MFS/spermidine synthase [Deltaproteobacteria bacterium]|nr:fused MFS/spermidine synthase [Deltaproteobacteria bacterium]
MTLLILAFLSGIPALVYQVVWTREIGLFAGSQVEAISAVLVSFFGGLALGARLLGPRADRARHPLRFYGALEMAAGVGAAASLFALRTLATSPRAAGSEALLLAPAAAILFPVTFLLGGTQPALLRAAVRDLRQIASRAGWIVGVNTAGSVVGVGLAMFMIPSAGLRATQLLAAAGSLTVGVAALALAGGGFQAAPRESPAPEARSVAPVWIAAALAGVATIAYEVLVARMAALQLGSSLFAWGAVLALFLLGLAAGNLAFSRRAAQSSHPMRDLGWIQAAAAISIGLGLWLLAPPLTAPARGLAPDALLAVAAGAAPAFLMGGAFPFFVRLGVPDARVGAGFGAVSAANTAGGILGALLAPFALLPWLGPVQGALACAGLNTLLAVLFLTRVGERGRAAAAVAAAALAALPALAGQRETGGDHALFVDHGRQATAAVVRVHNRRDLIVDGDPEASTGGDARTTEELLAALPLVMHPDPRTFLEVGLGSGITLGTATRFPLERIDCVELVDSVVRANPYFAPDNRGVTGGEHENLRIVRGDARVFLTRHPDRYDVIVANTLHPWSVGATGLYSREYFGRISGALRSGGIAVQWLPVHQIGARSLTAILRTFFDVFPHGGLWWGAGNLLLVGSQEPLPALDPVRIEQRLKHAGLTYRRLGLNDARELSLRAIADARVARQMLGSGDILEDDRPQLEFWATRGRGANDEAELRAVVTRMAEAALRGDRERGAILFWLESLEARARGEDARADSRESLAEAQGLALARRHRARRKVSEGSAELEAGRLTAARESFRSAERIDPGQRDALFSLAAMAVRDGRPASAETDLDRLLREHPLDAEAWNLMASVRLQRGDAQGARQALARALDADPYFPEVLTNAGLLALQRGDRPEAQRMLARLRACSPLGATPGEIELTALLQEQAPR